METRTLDVEDRDDDVTLRETVYYVVRRGGTLAKFFEAARAHRFATNFNLMDGAESAAVVAVELIGRAAAGREVPA